LQQLMFHKDVFIPDFAQTPLFEGKVIYSRHAKNVSAGAGGYAKIDLPAIFDASKAELIEVEVDPHTRQVTKQVWRQSLDEERDLCFPLVPGGVIPTVWLNDKADTHETLNKRKYIGSYQWRNMKNKSRAGTPS
jgi:hypothetical protein